MQLHKLIMQFRDWALSRSAFVIMISLSVFCVALTLVYETTTWQSAVADLRASTSQLRASNARLKSDDLKFRQDASTAKAVALLAAHVSAELLKNQTSAYDYRLNVCLQERDSIRARVLGFNAIASEYKKRAETDKESATRERDKRFAGFFNQLAQAEEMSQVQSCNHPRIKIRLKKL